MQDHRTIHVGWDLRSYLVQTLAQNSISNEVRPVSTRIGRLVLKTFHVYLGALLLDNQDSVLQILHAIPMPKTFIKLKPKSWSRCQPGLYRTFTTYICLKIFCTFNLFKNCVPSLWLCLETRILKLLLLFSGYKNSWDPVLNRKI